MSDVYQEYLGFRSDALLSKVTCGIVENFVH